MNEDKSKIVPIKTQTVKCLPSQWEFLNSKQPEVLYSGSAGSGKSIALCLKAVMQASIPGNVALLCRKWLVNLRLSTLRVLLEQEGDRPPVLPPGTYHHNRSEKTIKLHGGGTILYAGVGDDIERLRSMSSGIVLVDEMTELTEDEWLELHLRARISVGCGQIVGACNPSDTSHWAYRRFIADNRIENETKVVWGLSKDNRFLPASAQRTLNNLKGSAGERMRDGKWLGIDRLIYGNLPNGIFTGLMPELSQMQEWHISIDYGYTNPTFLLLAGVDCDGRVWIFKEKESSKMLIKDIIDWLILYYDRKPVVHVDPSAAGLIAEIQSKGFTCVKANNDVQIGIDKARDVMQAGLVRASAECTNLKRSLTGYVRKPDGKPEKEDDHGADSFRYLIMGAVGQKIEALLENLANPPSNYTFFEDPKAAEESDRSFARDIDGDRRCIPSPSPFLTLGDL